MPLPRTGPPNRPRRRSVLTVMRLLVAAVLLASVAAAGASGAPSRESQLSVREFPVPAGTHPHDVAPARDGGVWYTAQHTGELGWMNPRTGRSRLTPLGAGSAPHGVIVGPDGAPWITDGGLNAIVRVDPRTRKVRRFPLPASSGYTNLNTATFDRRGILWFTGQSGIYGRLEPRTGKMRVFRAPTRRRAVRHHDDAVGRRLLLLARGQLRRQHRRPYRQGDGARATDRRPGGATRLVRLARAGSGSASGTPGRSGCTTRAPAAGASGRFRARTR